MNGDSTYAADDSVHGSTGSPRTRNSLQTESSPRAVRGDTLAAITVTLVAAWPNRVEERILSLASGATLRDALLLAGDVAVDSLDESDLDVGVWGKRVPLESVLRDGDRIERYRPITADPKQARHHRASEQGYRWQGRTRRAAQRT
jgi:uncharacterized protein